MATLADQMYADVMDVCMNTDEHAVTVDVTPTNATVVHTVGIFDAIEDADGKPQPDGISVPRTATMKLAEAEVDRPKMGWSVKVTKTTHPLYNIVYKVERSQPDGHGMYDVYVVKHDSWEKSTEGHRLHRSS